MKARVATAATFALAFAVLTACRQSPDDPATTSAEPEASGALTAPDGSPAAGTAPAAATTEADPTVPAGDATMASAALSENAALGVLNAINDHEIAAGQQALGKGVAGEVAAYAQMMVAQHSENRTRTNTFGPDAEAAEARAQRQKGEQELARLNALTGDAYSHAYIEAMVKGHSEALDALDRRLIPSAARQEVKDHLATTREHVADHLERAKALQPPPAE
ncbi:DUF4142 domain-containing protein [Pseudoxanthomonas sp.]|uniref:DUF4142 domain-containing protein n=1 Tax=Pseudoxanthomonas sp. TaxID=1871049 RepID=UPI00258705AB|nr:DUF4142 domain-containing protein [Pseudoxanthomonas sp.]MCR6686380.1 DUF4142 domain-containing protein [Pseudoxanthomonas sp.]